MISSFSKSKRAIVFSAMKEEYSDLQISGDFYGIYFENILRLEKWKTIQFTKMFLNMLRLLHKFPFSVIKL